MFSTAAPPSVADYQLANRITSQLAETNRANLKRLSVNVTAGQVTLCGSVGSFYERQIAIQTCRELPGIDRLIDAVEVAEGN
jgi:osmotically-inducible protein OsmY